MNDKSYVKIKGCEAPMFAPLVEAVMQQMHKLARIAGEDDEVMDALHALLAYVQESTPKLDDKVRIEHVHALLGIEAFGHERGGEDMVDLLLNANGLEIQEMHKRGGKFDFSQLEMPKPVADIIRAARFDVARSGEVTFQSPLDKLHPETVRYDRERSTQENTQLNIASVISAGINPGEGAILPLDGFWRDSACGGRQV